MRKWGGELHGLAVTGSVGILVKAKQLGFPLVITETIVRLHRQGIWLGKDVEQFLRRTVN